MYKANLQVVSLQIHLMILFYFLVSVRYNKQHVYPFSWLHMKLIFIYSTGFFSLCILWIIFQNTFS